MGDVTRKAYELGDEMKKFSDCSFKDLAKLSNLSNEIYDMNKSVASYRRMASIILDKSSIALSEYNNDTKIELNIKEMRYSE
jgi:hypothetical protein